MDCIKYQDRLGILSVAGFDRKAANLVAKWDSFQDREAGFFPPKIAALFLGRTTQALYSSAERGVIQYLSLGVSRFYSRKDITREYEKSLKKALDDATTPLDRHLQKMTGKDVKSLPRRPHNEAVLQWCNFLQDVGGAYPAKVAASHLRMTAQGVRCAHKAGWIRAIVIGRENFYSRSDVHSYWWHACRKNTCNRPRPRFVGKEITARL